MRQKMICLVIAALLLSIVPGVAPAGPQPVSGGPDSNGGGGGGGGSHLSLQSFSSHLESWQKDNPTKYQYMVELLSKGSVVAYKEPTIALGYSKNKSINRNEQLDIKFQVLNPNSIDLRIPLFVDLEAKVQGDDDFKKVNQNSMVVQPFAYLEKGKLSLFEASWPEISTPGRLDKIGVLKLNQGVIKFRAVYNDGSRKKYSSDWIFIPPYYGELSLNLTNRLPEMKNVSLVAPNQTRYNDPIEYKANIEDLDRDLLNVTLHILDAKGEELKNVTQMVLPGAVSFKSSQFGFFSEFDAGKNFTYYYSFDDGINSNRTRVWAGPNIRQGPKLYIDKLNVTPQSSNCYWWQKYTFCIRAKNLNPESFDVVFTLSSRTENGDWRTIESKTVNVGPEPQMIYFNKTEPFLVTDANATSFYRIKLSEYDQTGKDVVEAVGPKINAKIVPYSINDPVIIVNVALLLSVILLGSLALERRHKNGIASNGGFGKAGGNNGQDKDNCSSGVAGNDSEELTGRD